MHDIAKESRSDRLVSSSIDLERFQRGGEIGIEGNNLTLEYDYWCIYNRCCYVDALPVYLILLTVID